MLQVYQSRMEHTIIEAMAMQKRSNTNMDSTICLIIPYFGKWPVYLDLFFYTVAKQDHFQVILFSDIDYDGELPQNVKMIHFTLDEFNQLASHRLGFGISLKNPYKLCDFKPAYGFIFQDYISDYSHWAFGDLDLIYGRISEILPANWFDYDVLSFREEWISGSFSVMKNTSYINTLFTKSRSYKEAFMSPEHQAFDECWNLYETLKGKESDYILKCDKRESFTWIVRREALENNIKVFFHRLIKESISQDDYVKYYDGKVEQRDGRDFLYYHYITEKNTFAFVFPEWNEVPDQFYIDRTGFFTVDEYLSWKRTPIRWWRIFRGSMRFIDSLPKRIYLKIKRTMQR